VASLGSYIRSAARATFSAYRSLPIRWRLAGGSAALTFVILASFASIVGVLTTRQVRGQFNDEVRSAADQLQGELNGKLRYIGQNLNCNSTKVHLNDFASTEHAQIRIFDHDELLCTQNKIRLRGAKAPFNTELFTSPPDPSVGSFTENGYRIAVRPLAIQPIDNNAELLYARPLSDVDHTLARVQFFLLLGVVGGTILALLAGLATAQRATRPIAELTLAAREIERTRDPSLHIPHPEARDEIAELASTLEGMLGALDASRSETEAMLDRQREFVADASHELRTPITSLRTNIEVLLAGGELSDEDRRRLLADVVEQSEELSALIGDLIELARGDLPHDMVEDIRLDRVLEESISRARRDHPEVAFEASLQPVTVEGVPERLGRAVNNLLDNAARHSPAHGVVEVTVNADGLRVRDHGSGVDEADLPYVFDRFYRGKNSRGRQGSGLGLAIVRQVAVQLGGSVDASNAPDGGAIFSLYLPTVDTDESQAQDVRLWAGERRAPV